MQENAFNAASKLSDYGPANVVPVEVRDEKLFRLRIGPFDSDAEAEKALKGVISSGLRDAKVVMQ